MASALPAAHGIPTAASAPTTFQPGKFRDLDNQDSDASESDQSDAGGRSLSPTRKALTKSGKRKERKQFGALTDELGDLLGAAFQSKVDASPLAANGANDKPGK